MFKNNDITLYVPFYNAWSTIWKCLEGVKNQTLKPSSVIIVDDGSDIPFSEDNVKKAGMDIRVLNHDINSGLSAARNSALNAASTPLIASLDSDVMPEKGWLEKLLYAINNNPVEGAGGKLTEYFSDNLGDRWRAVHMCQHWGDKTIMNPRFIYGANNIFKTDTLKNSGGYIRDLKTNYEDMSLSEAIYSKGLNLIYEPSAACYHLRRDDEVSILPGFWKWFHAKGVLKGDFKSSARLLSRIDNVNFGIYRYRFDQDVTNKRSELLLLDSLIPWVFTALDLQFASKSYGVSVPLFPDNDLLEELPLPFRDLFLKIIKAGTTPVTKETWHSDYIAKFKKCLSDFNWRNDLQTSGCFLYK